MAEELGPKFGHIEDGGMTYLNRKIVDRLKRAQNIISDNDNTCSAADVHDLRIIVRETISYMTAVLIQSLIDSMVIGERISRILRVHVLCHLFLLCHCHQNMIPSKRNSR